eukprot:TRINITY_DN6132_c0_g1_i1.p1 TRINITY_DN6132_c0_g1~~TRINITY_DN6132_c0_g1_i1.p1  ORF type:complete len:263 (-),score=37.63 TRINITY_DN6132_c0_g1_i1:136-924(-)
MLKWSPAKYMKFGTQRLRPALDLLRAINVVNPKLIIDLGCGPGNITPFLAENWPEAKIVGVDLAEDMIIEANKNNPIPDRIRYVQSSIESFSPSEPVDVIYANASLHWITDHDIVLPKLLSYLSPQGVLAVQIPDTRVQPSHVLMKTAAKNIGLEDKIKEIRIPRCEKDQDWYYNILQPHCSAIEVWTSTYLQVVEGDHPVPKYTSSTGMMPILKALGGADSVDGQRFKAEYQKLTDEAYPRREDGKTLFPFTRFFFTATKK